MFTGSLGLFCLFVQNKILFLKVCGDAVDKKNAMKGVKCLFTKGVYIKLYMFYRNVPSYRKV